MVHHIRRIYNGCRDPPNIRPVGFLNAVGFARSFNLKIWKKKVLQFDLERHLLYAEKDKKIKNYDLTNYLLRASKCKDYFCFVLEAVNNKPHDKSRTVHIGFDSPSRFEEWYEAMKVSMEYAQWKFVKDMMSDPMARTNTSMFFRRGEIIQSDSMGSSEEEVVDSPLNRSCTLADLTRQKRNM